MKVYSVCVDGSRCIHNTLDEAIELIYNDIESTLGSEELRSEGDCTPKYYVEIEEMTEEELRAYRNLVGSNNPTQINYRLHLSVRRPIIVIIKKPIITIANAANINIITSFTKEIRPANADLVERDRLVGIA